MGFRDRIASLLLPLFARDRVDGPIITDQEISPIGSFYATRMELSSQRIKLYKEYYDMAQDALISGALDLYAEEATLLDHVQRASIWPHSSNPAVDKELRRMFDQIDIEDHIYGIARYLATMGDNFVHPLWNAEKGIVSLEFVEAEDVERIVDKHNRLVGFKFAGGRDLLDPWVFVHFRIISRSKSVKYGGSIYGTSMLENARKTWRQLTLLEDALVIYRLELGGRHRVFYIDVGTQSHEQGLRTAMRYQREFQKKKYFNPASGEWTSRFNPLHLSTDIFWPVRKNSESRIDYLGSDPNVSAISDVEYFRSKLFATLKVPRAYIGGDDYSASRYSLSQIDVVFARHIKRLQRALVSGFYRMGQIHLKLRGIDPLDPANDFELMTCQISTLDQQQRIEVMDMAITLAAKLRELVTSLGYPEEKVSRYIAKHVLGLSPYDLQAVGATDGDTGPRTFSDSEDEIDPETGRRLVEEVTGIIDRDPSLKRIIERMKRSTSHEATNEDSWSPLPPSGTEDQTSFMDQ